MDKFHRIITFGSWDLFHGGHVLLLERIRDLLLPGGELIVGVSSDDLQFSKKQKSCVFDQDERMHMIDSLDFVHQVFLEESLEEKLNYCLKYQASCLVMGSDHEDEYDFLIDQIPYSFNTVYLPRTEWISTTEIIAAVLTQYHEYKGRSYA